MVPVATSVVAHGRRGLGGPRQQVLQAETLQGRIPGHGGVEIVHVGLVMAVVVDRHRGGIDRRLQGIGGIGEGREREGWRRRPGPLARPEQQQHQHQQRREGPQGAKDPSHRPGPGDHQPSMDRSPENAGKRTPGCLCGVQPSSAQQAAKAAAGSAAALIGRPITNRLAPALRASAGVITRR